MGDVSASDDSHAGDHIASSDKGAEDTELTYNRCPYSTALGGFDITLAEKYTGVNGQVLDGVVPGNVPVVVAEDDSCTLLKAPSLFCDPPCVPGETCGTGGTCLPYPASRSVGTVTVEGLNEPCVMEAKWGNHYTNPGSMIHPGFEVGADIRLKAAGDELESFSLKGAGVSALEVPSKSLNVEKGKALDVQWESGGDQGGVRVQLELNINNHGSNSAWIRCVAGDTGSYSVPAGLIDALFDEGLSGYPSLTLTRQSADAVSISAGCVELTVSSQASVAIDVEGVVSCTNDSQCPKGQNCGVDLQCK